MSWNLTSVCCENRKVEIYFFLKNRSQSFNPFKLTRSWNFRPTPTTLVLKFKLPLETTIPKSVRNLSYRPNTDESYHISCYCLCSASSILNKPRLASSLSMPTNITRLAIFSRLLVIFLQCVSNHLVQDHDAGDVFRSPMEPLKRKKCDTIIDVLLGGFRSWDAEYFLHIAEHGYTYENTLAFLPLYPLCIKLLRFAIINVTPFLSVRALSLLIGVIINVVFFAKAANTLFELGCKVFRDQKKAELAAILFCFNPASIFFTAPYTESLFSWLSFLVMLKCFEDIDSVLIIVPLSLSILCRSNGLLNIGFIVFYGLRKMFAQTSMLSFVTVFLKIVSMLIIIAFHFGLMQVYNYYLFCLKKSFSFPLFIKDFAVKNDLVLAGNRTDETVSPWCSSNLPISYSYVQDHYWHVGFLRYYELKQIPNFLLASPIVFIILVNSFKYFQRNKAFCWRLGIFNLKPSVLRSITVGDQNQFVFIVHAVALTIFCVLFIHVQVTTRMLCSSNPMLYFFAADIFLKNYNQHRKKNDDGDVFDIKKLSLPQKLIICFFLSYYTIGTVLFSNFLPWT